MDAPHESVLPLRPLTVGELLDASVGVLRRCGWPLLALGLVFAVGVQVVSDLARSALPPFSLTHPADWPVWWLWLSCRLGAESVVLAVLAAPAGATAAGVLAGTPTAPGPAGALRWLAAPGRRWWPTLAVAVVTGVLAGGAALMCGLPWLFGYGLTGLIVPTLVIDRTSGGRAVGRGLRLVFAGAGRPAAIRLLGYLGWLLVRFAVGYAGETLVSRLDPGPVLLPVLVALPWILVNAVAFPALACLDACVHVENRMRVEGLDLALRRGDARAALEAV